jgi:hypothetical protein
MAASKLSSGLTGAGLQTGGKPAVISLNGIAQKMMHPSPFFSMNAEAVLK